MRSSDTFTVFLCRGGGNDVDLEESLYKYVEKFFSQKRQVGSPWVLKKDRSKKFHTTACLYNSKTMVLHNEYARQVVLWEQSEYHKCALRIQQVESFVESLEMKSQQNFKADNREALKQKLTNLFKDAEKIYSNIRGGMNIKTKCPSVFKQRPYVSKEDLCNKFEKMKQVKDHGLRLLNRSTGPTSTSKTVPELANQAKQQPSEESETEYSTGVEDGQSDHSEAEQSKTKGGQSDDSDTTTEERKKRKKPETPIDQAIAELKEHKHQTKKRKKNLEKLVDKITQLKEEKHKIKAELLNLAKLQQAQEKERDRVKIQLFTAQEDYNEAKKSLEVMQATSDSIASKFSELFGSR